MGKKKSTEQATLPTMPAEEVSISGEIRKILEHDKTTSPSEIVRLLIAQYPQFAGKEKTIASTASAIRSKMGVSGGKRESKESNGDLHDLEIENKALRLLYSTGDIDAVLASIDELKENPAFDFVNSCGGIARAKERLSCLGV